MALRFLIGKQRQCMGIMGQNRLQFVRRMTEDSVPLDLEEAETDDMPREQQRRRLQTFNEVTLLGFLGADPVQRQTSNDKKFVFVPLATDSYFKTESGEILRSVMWHKVIFKRASLQAYALRNLTKGSRVFISGSLINQRIPIHEELIERPLTVVLVDKAIQLWKPVKKDEIEEE